MPEAVTVVGVKTESDRVSVFSFLLWFLVSSFTSSRSFLWKFEVHFQSTLPRLFSSDSTHLLNVHLSLPQPSSALWDHGHGHVHT